MNLQRAHRINAAMLGLFLILHLSNHFVGIGGIELHLQAQELLRPLYRSWPLEPILLALFAAQIGLGLALVFRRGWPTGGWAWAQVASGLYLVFFLLQHVPAVVLARYGGLDTSSYFAASVVNRAPFVWYFAPYYTLAIAALFTHLACALRFRIWPAPATIVQRGLPVFGLVLGVLVVAGLIRGVELPPAYEAYLQKFER